MVWSVQLRVSMPDIDSPRVIWKAVQLQGLYALSQRIKSPSHNIGTPIKALVFNSLKLGEFET